MIQRPRQPASPAPRIVVTVADARKSADPELAGRKNRLYVEAIVRHGGEPIVLDEASSQADREAAFSTMDGLMMSGGADLDPSRYGRPNLGSTSVEQGRDELEWQAWRAAAARATPVLGICRGFQAINAFSGGTLLQHVDGHLGASWGKGPAKEHALRVVPGTRLARILFPTNVRGGVLRVNSYHHQAIGSADLAPGLLADAWATSPAGDLIEGFESVGAGSRFLMGVQCHPERTESTPAVFERLFSVFVDAARGAASDRGWAQPAPMAGRR